MLPCPEAQGGELLLERPRTFLEQHFGKVRIGHAAFGARQAEGFAPMHDRFMCFLPLRSSRVDGANFVCKLWRAITWLSAPRATH